MDLSIVIPTYNENANILELVNRIHTSLAPLAIQYEIWFIDDSTDHTPQLLKEIASHYKDIHYLHRENQRGLGSAVVEGYKHSQGQYLIVMDADLQHPPELLPQLYQELILGNDIVIPSRFIKGGSDGGLNIFRKLVSWVARTIGRIAIKRFRNISDCTSGYFGLNRKVIEGVNLNPCSWKILMEILLYGHYHTIREIPYQFVARDAGESKMTVKEQWNYLRHIAKLVWNSPADRRFYLIFFTLLIFAIFVDFLVRF